MEKLLPTEQVEVFQNYLIDWSDKYGRHDLPWRLNYDPYTILVSELMLQQTQVERVIPKFNEFMELFPTLEKLAEAPLAQVLIAWQGLGYNRRAKFLQKCALAVMIHYDGIFPSTEEELLQLPGIGPYTASALSAFAFNQPTLMIETNIRTVYIHHFFPDQETVTDLNMKPLIKQTMLTDNPRLWYSTLMDYGTHLKKVLPNPSRKSKSYAKQSAFQGSSRQVRGEIIRKLSKQPTITEKELYNQLSSNRDYYHQALTQLLDEAMIIRDGDQIKLITD